MTNIKLLMIGACAAVSGCAGVATENRPAATDSSAATNGSTPIAGVTEHSGGYYEQAFIAITPHLRYPKMAMMSAEEGTCRVRIEMISDGTILSTSLTKSAGYKDLDAECLEVFSRVGTLPPMPVSKTANAVKVVFDMPITFSLSAHK